MPVTAVVAANKNLRLTKSWYEDFRTKFSDQPIVISCLQAKDPELEAYIRSIESSVTRIVVGSPVDQHKVSFSECYNAALNLVQTDKFVLVHNDMQFSENFFSILDQELSDLGEGNFIQYITFEAPVFVNHHRAGKIIKPWTSWEDLNQWSQEMRSLPEFSSEEILGGFFIAGYMKDIYCVGGFDQETYEVFCEDDDLVLRKKLAGYKTYLSNYACTYHFVSQTSNTFDRNRLERNASAKFYEKWGILPYQLYNLPFNQIEEIIKARQVGIVSSFDTTEPNYLELQKQIKYE